jgi:hypothetical protein
METYTKIVDGLEIAVRKDTLIATLTLVDFNIGAVEVYGPRSQFGTDIGAQVNWSGIGSVEPNVARAYGTLLKAAADVAQEWVR